MAIARYARRTPYAPWLGWEDMTNRLSHFLEEPRLSTDTTRGTWSPPVNISETKEKLVLTAELPGLEEENVQVEVEDGVLTISGEKTKEYEGDDAERRYHVWERTHGSFRRAFTLPRTVRAEGISATFDHGVLTVDLPKAAEAKGRRIELGSRENKG